jgi:D-alanine-D-alanine ligase-like ATP-grasp enzyme
VAQSQVTDGRLMARTAFLDVGNIHAAGCVMWLKVPPDSELPPAGALAAFVEGCRPPMAADVQLPALAAAEAATPAGKVARLALDLQRAAGIDVRLLREAAAAGGPAIFACPDEATGRAALALALRAAGGRADPPGALLEEFHEAVKNALHSLPKAAAQRGIPCSVALRGKGTVRALGHGRKRRLFLQHYSPATTQVGVAISTRKDKAAELMRDAGLPAPSNVLVWREDEAVRAATRFGYPVVVKPVAADFGRGVTTGIADEAQLRAAFRRAREHGGVLVEQQIPGDHHRLLVMHGRCIAVSRRLPARVVGDGHATIAELVERVNATRTETLSPAGVKIKLDEVAQELMREQGVTAASIPAPGQVVVLRGNANQSAGGTVEMMTEVAHPEVLRLAVQAARLFHIDVAGIDYLTTDVTRSPAETGGAICEINVTPGFVNQGDEVALMGSMLAPFFPDGDNGRIPSLVLLGAAPAREGVAGAMAALLGEETVRADHMRSWPRDGGAPSLPRRVRMALADPMAAAVLIPCAAEEIMAQGLGLDRADLLVCTEGATEATAAAILRVSRRIVVSAAMAAAMPRLLDATASRAWIAGDPAPALHGRCAGWVRRADAATIEAQGADGTAWRIAAPPGEEALLLAAAGAALGLPAGRIAQALESLRAAG